MALVGSSLRDLTDARAADISIVDANGDQTGVLANPLVITGSVTSTAVAPPSTGTITSVASSASSVSILASNPNRKKFIIFNDSSKTLSVAFDTAAASLTNFSLKIAAAGVYEGEVGGYTGPIQGIWVSANGFARITELT